MTQAKQPFHRRTYAEVNLAHLKSNFDALNDLLPRGTFFCPMVKANAYGHGDIEVARALREAGATHLGVGLIEEGIHLRSAGDSGELLLMGAFDPPSAQAVLEHRLTPVLSEWHQLNSLADALRTSPPTQESTSRDHENQNFTRASAAPPFRSCLKIHFTFNTGMNRLGFDCDQAPRLAEWLRAHPEFELEGVATHLLRGDDAGIPGGESESQLDALAKCVSAFQEFQPHVHALNSSGTLSLWQRAVQKLPLGQGGKWPLGSRPGISIYGVNPSTQENVTLQLKPVLSLKSSVVMLHHLSRGDRVSYGPTWRAERPSLIGVVPMGYGDGYFRLLSNRATVLCKGVRVKIAGSVCMNYFMIDLTDLESQGGSIELGEEIVLIGEQRNENGVLDQIAAQDLADLIGTIPYEILTNINERVPRLYITTESA